jgi:hypothetical protein
MACGSSTEPTAEESRGLDNAEAMLNAAPEELSAIHANELAEPEQNATAD